MNFDEGVRYFFCEGVGRVSITFSIVISAIKLSKGLGCVIISVHDHNGRPFVTSFDDKVRSLSECTDGVPFSTGEVAGTSSRRFPVNLRVDCVDILVKGCIHILSGYPYTFFIEAVVAGGPRGTVIWGRVVCGGLDVKEFTES